CEASLPLARCPERRTSADANAALDVVGGLTETTLTREGDYRMERRLTAILAADVVGYSRLMGADEVGTLQRLKACRRELVDPSIAEHHGRMIKLMGDGALVEFGSVVDGVQCAADIQRKMAERD